MIGRTLPLFKKIYAYISDIHLEKWLPHQKPVFEHKIKPENTDGILLAGDIGYPKKDNYYSFLYKASYTFPKVFLLSGNHEYDRGSHSEINKNIIDIVNKLPNKNVYYLQNENIELSNNYSLLGTTLWSKNVNKSAFDSNVYWLEEQLQDSDKKYIVLTHHLPTKTLIEDFYLKNYNNHKNFYSDLDYLIRSPITHWICGHSHSVQTIRLNEVELHMNCFGNKALREKTKEKIKLPLKYIYLQ